MTCSATARRMAIFALVVLGLVSATAFATAHPWTTARQLILVTTPDWNSTDGKLQRFVRDRDGWHAFDAEVPVVIGRAGSAWGIGLHPAQQGLQKKEGDGRSPAGVFALGTAFGYARSIAASWAYAPMDAAHWCIDVERSALYNRIVDARVVGRDAIAGSTEPMRLDVHADRDMRYKLGLVIAHNPRNLAGAGSCIFAHLWSTADSSTAGCTAMAEPAMQALLGWLRPDAHPVFVLLPQAEYLRLRDAWGLPSAGPPATPSR